MARARSSRSSSNPDPILVGVVKRAVGLRGDVEVAVESDVPTRFDRGSRLLAGDDLRPLTVVRSRAHGDRRIVAFDGIDDRTGAETLRRQELFVSLDAIEELPEGRYWDHELVGCEMVDLDGSAVGQVVAVEHPPGNDLLVVDTGEGERLVPLVRAIVCEVDVTGRRMVIDPPPGLLD